MLQNIQPLEILILVLVVVVLFTARRFPELMRSIGVSKREFRKGLEHGAESNQSDSTPDDR